MTTNNGAIPGWNPDAIAANTINLEKQSVHLTVSDGLRFGIGFAVAALIFTIVLFIALPLGLAVLVAV